MRTVTPIVIILVLVSLGRSAFGSGEEKSKDSLSQAREIMIESQIVNRGIVDERVIKAIRAVERHKFVPEEYAAQAYADSPLPIGYDQTISQPYIVALMTELADIDSTDKVLEIGTGSGYQAAILAELAAKVFTIEIVKPLAERSRALLERLGYDNVTVRSGDGFAGWVEEAPFDAIVVTCAPEEIPPPLIEQLADGGRLVIPVGDFWQELILLTKKGEKLTRKSVAPVRFVPMTGEAVK